MRGFTKGGVVKLGPVGSPSGGGGSWSLKNTILVDPDEDVIAGKRYKTIVAAQAYAAAQSPTANNLWTILIGGVNTENFSVTSYCRIVGIKNAVLTGLVDSGTVVADMFEFVIKDCTLTNINMTGNALLACIGCEIKGCNPTGGYLLLLLDGTYVTGGDFSALNMLAGMHCDFNGATIIAGAAVKFYVTNFTTCVLKMGEFHNCPIDLSSSFNLTGDIFLSACDTNCNMAIPGGNTVYIHGGTAKNIVIDAGATLNTEGVALGMVTNNGTWNNKGDVYDNSASGLAAAEEQAAIDEIALNHILGTQIFS